MNNKITSLLTSKVKKVSFIYKKSEQDVSQRVIELGKEVIVPLLSGGVSWGYTQQDSKIVEHKGKTYLQGVETVENEKKIKRFDLEKIENFEIVEEV
jgi:hypothetical protein